MIRLARELDVDCAGVVCPARFNGGSKAGIDLLDVRSGERWPLAKVDGRPAELRTSRYRFDAEVMAWGGAILAAACPCDALIVDELGPLELEQGRGWVGALDVKVQTMLGVLCGLKVWATLYFSARVGRAKIWLWWEAVL